MWHGTVAARAGDIPDLEESALAAVIFLKGAAP